MSDVYLYFNSYTVESKSNYIIYEIELSVEMIHKVLQSVVGTVMGIVVGGGIMWQLGHGGEAFVFDLVLSSAAGAAAGSLTGLLIAGITGGVIGGLVAVGFAFFPAWLIAVPGLTETVTIILVSVCLGALAPLIVPH